MAAGGKREGAGRKGKAEELKTAKIAMDALISKYGDKETALKSLIDSGEPSLIKFVYEHAFGRPTEKHDVELKSSIEAPSVNIITSNVKLSDSEQEVDKEH